MTTSGKQTPSGITFNPINLYCRVLEQQKTTQTVLKGIMLSRLKDKVHDPEEFCKWMKQTGAVMCGSFPLQIMLNEEWKDSDIDIYVMGAQYPRVSNIGARTPEPIKKKLENDRVGRLRNENVYLRNMVLERKAIDWDKVVGDPVGKTIFTKVGDVAVLHTSVATYTKFGCLLKYGLKKRVYWGTTSSNHYNTSLITDIGEYSYTSVQPCEKCTKYTHFIGGCKQKCYEKCKNTKIQIIHLNPDMNSSIKEFVGKFDLDFCKVMFDGEKFTVLEPQSVVTRTSKYNKIEDWHHQKDKRVAKYTKRGFTILAPEKKHEKPIYVRGNIITAPKKKQEHDHSGAIKCVWCDEDVCPGCSCICNDCTYGSGYKRCSNCCKTYQQ